MQEGDQSRSLIHNTSLCVFILEFSHRNNNTKKTCCQILEWEESERVNGGEGEETEDEEEEKESINQLHYLCVYIIYFI